MCVPASGSSPAVGFLFELTARACISLLLMDHGQKASLLLSALEKGKVFPSFCLFILKDFVYVCVFVSPIAP